MLLRERKRNRLKYFNYSDAGWYFVTVCVYRHECVLGYIKNGQMVLNDYGHIINCYWKQIPKHYHTVELDEFMVMPNHVHGIIVIRNFNKNINNVSLSVNKCV